MSNFDLITGEKARVSGYYAYDGPAKGTVSCIPTKEEQVIPLEKNETAPPVKSCELGAKWRFLRSK